VNYSTVVAIGVGGRMAGMTEILQVESESGEQVALVDGAFEFTNTCLNIRDDISYEEWEKLGQTLRVYEGGVRWWLGDWLNYGEKAYGEKYAQAMDATEMEYQTLVNVSNVAKKFESNRRRLNLSWSHHAEVAALPPADADEILDKAESEGITKREVRKEAVLSKQRNLPTPSFPDGTYRVIYTDPPWKYADERALKSGSAQAQYPLLDTGAICQLTDSTGRRIQDISQPNAVCFLWATAPLLPDAFRVMEAWGFIYKAQFVWDKLRGFNGHYNDVQHELLLIGTKGSCVPDSDKLKASVVGVARTTHSKKPDEFVEIIESMYTRGPYVEIFSRTQRKGWSVFGNQI